MIGSRQTDLRCGSSLRAAVALCALLSWVVPAHAQLGAGVASVEADSRDLQGVVQTSALIDYDIYQIATPAGQSVREFVSRGGRVFAVTWSGPVPPDLAQLLGSHYAAYAAALATLQHAGLQRAVRVRLPDLTVESNGHLRAYSGRAYLPAMLPAGVQIADIL